MGRVDWLNPLLGNHLSREILRCISNYLIGLVDHEEGARMTWRRYVVEIECTTSPGRHHGANIICEPESLSDVRACTVALHVSFCHEKRDTGRQPIVFPDLNYVAYAFWLQIQIIPRSAGRIVLEGKEGE